MILNLAFEHMKTLLFVLLPLSTAHAQQAALKPVTGKKVALVIGNNGYTASPLKNCVSDAAAIAKLLREQLGFNTVLADRDSENLDRLAFTRRLQAFQKEALGAAVAVFYYAGHGMEDFDGRDNYLIPVDADLTEAAKDNAGLQAQGIPLELVLKTMKEATQGAKIILLDCCRERPADRAIQTRDGGGFVMPTDSNMPQDTLIMLAAAPARTASDGEGHGPFTAALIKHLPSPGTALFQTFRTVRHEVLTATHQQQKPWLKLDGAGDFFYDHVMVVGVTANVLIQDQMMKEVRSPNVSKFSQGERLKVVLPSGKEVELCFCQLGKCLTSQHFESAHKTEAGMPLVTINESYWLAKNVIDKSYYSEVVGVAPRFVEEVSQKVWFPNAEAANRFIEQLNLKFPVRGWRWVVPTEDQWVYASESGGKLPVTDKPNETEEKKSLGGFFRRLFGRDENPWGLIGMKASNLREWCSTPSDGYRVTSDSAIRQQGTLVIRSRLQDALNAEQVTSLPGAWLRPALIPAGE